MAGQKGGLRAGGEVGQGDFACRDAVKQVNSTRVASEGGLSSPTEHLPGKYRLCLLLEASGEESCTPAQGHGVRR